MPGVPTLLRPSQDRVGGELGSVDRRRSVPAWRAKPSRRRVRRRATLRSSVDDRRQVGLDDIADPIELAEAAAVFAVTSSTGQRAFGCARLGSRPRFYRALSARALALSHAFLVVKRGWSSNSPSGLGAQEECTGDRQTGAARCLLRTNSESLVSRSAGPLV